jgi:hypothetical protein
VDSLLVSEEHGPPLRGGYVSQKLD